MAEQQEFFGRREYVHPVLKQLISYGNLFDRTPGYWSEGRARFPVLQTVAGSWTARYARTLSTGEHARFPALETDWNLIWSRCPPNPTTNR